MPSISAYLVSVVSYGFSTLVMCQVLRHPFTSFKCAESVQTALFAHTMTRRSGIPLPVRPNNVEHQFEFLPCS
jgi:hypothetical protein